MLFPRKFLKTLFQSTKCITLWILIQIFLKELKIVENVQLSILKFVQTSVDITSKEGFSENIFSFMANCIQADTLMFRQFQNVNVLLLNLTGKTFCSNLKSNSMGDDLSYKVVENCIKKQIKPSHFNIYHIPYFPSDYVWLALLFWFKNKFFLCFSALCQDEQMFNIPRFASWNADYTWMRSMQMYLSLTRSLW